jgi:hypothetical protein
LIDSVWEPADVLAMTTALASMWTNAPDSLAALAEDDRGPFRDRRGIVEEAIRRTLRPRQDNSGEPNFPESDRPPHEKRMTGPF